MIEPYYQDRHVTIYHGDALEVLPQLGPVDTAVTDPPYGLSFMGKDWDRAVPSVAIWQAAIGVLKPGAFASVMCTPRQDCLAEMIRRLGLAGFETGFSSLLWTYATGFPKAANLRRMALKRLENALFEQHGVESVEWTDD